VVPSAADDEPVSVDSATQGVATRPRPRGFLRWFLSLPPVLYRFGLARWLGNRMLLLTTTGRRMGRRRTVALNFASDGEGVYVLSGFGITDWFRNLLADPQVAVQIGQDRWRGEARPVTDPEERRRARALVFCAGAGQGPPRPIRPLLARLGMDYDTEIRSLEDPSLDRPAVAIRRMA
jgi:deazaflavin-dependent oxidoreductase (nitroreductase family)